MLLLLFISLFLYVFIIKSFFILMTRTVCTYTHTKCKWSTGFIVCLPKKAVKNKKKNFSWSIWLTSTFPDRAQQIISWYISNIYHTHLYKCHSVFNTYRCCIISHRRALLFHTYFMLKKKIVFLYIYWIVVVCNSACSNMDMFYIEEATAKKVISFYLLFIHFFFLVASVIYLLLLSYY